jgi:hypothetical protein
MSSFFEELTTSLAELVDEDSLLGQFHNGVSELRSGLYQHNFFVNPQDEGTLANEETLIAPTPLEMQYQLFTAYDSIYQPIHDLYSIIYKPLVLTYYALGITLQAGAFALQACSTIYSDLTRMLLCSADIDLPTNDKDHNALTEMGHALACLASALYVSIVWLPVDTTCSALSFITRTLCSIIDSCAEFYQDLQDRKAQTTYKPE